MPYRTRAVSLWIMLTVCMILHVSYHLTEAVYGIDIRRPDANGTVPPTLVAVRFAFQLAPMLIATAILFFDGLVARRVHLALAGLITLAHASHLAGELAQTPLDPSQVVLLTVTLILSSALVVAARGWLKEPISAT